ncbi:MAG: AmmeMemoRadiSam system radical SAM enzyme [Candidatus Omnitrophota bacterium]|nr:AmmeMemoRadiSam system radical SAM enzyme [Candidatus Omnitrophota bacterium]
MKEAYLYEKLENKAVKCLVCAHCCRIQDNNFGICKARQNINGTLHTAVYGKAVSLGIDPIEKKPLYHFFPGTTSFSFAARGCNFHCCFCQNWEISQSPAVDSGFLGEDFLPEEIVQASLKHGCKSISYTYSEPTVFFEYAFDTAKLAKEKGLYNNFVTNGFMTKDCLQMIRPYLDAANVDLKFFRDESYFKICSGSLKPVLDSIKEMHNLGIWIEITTLIIPGENDSKEELCDIAGFIACIDKNIPWHVSRFHPYYKFIDHSITPEATLRMAQEIGYKEGLKFVYAGNVSGWGNNTLCPVCKKILIKREGFSILENNISSGKCLFCNAVIPGVFK